MTLARSSKFSDSRPVLYWFEHIPFDYYPVHLRGVVSLWGALPCVLWLPKQPDFHDLSLASRALPLVLRRLLGSSHKVSFPPQREAAQVHITRVCLTRYVPLSGFLNLLAVSTSNCPEALFHASGTHGVLPAEPSPWKQRLSLVGIDYLACRVRFLFLLPPAWKQSDSWFITTRRRIWTNKHQALKALIRFQVRSHPVPVLPFAGGRCSHGTYSLTGRASTSPT